MLFSLFSLFSTAHALSGEEIEASTQTLSERLERIAHTFLGYECPSDEKEAKEWLVQGKTTKEELDLHCELTSRGFVARSIPEICARDAGACDPESGFPKEVWVQIRNLGTGESTGHGVIPMVPWYTLVQEEPRLFAGTGIPERPGLFVLFADEGEFRNLVEGGDGLVVGTLQVPEMLFEAEDCWVGLTGEGEHSLLQVATDASDVTISGLVGPQNR